MRPKDADAEVMRPKDADAVVMRPKVADAMANSENSHQTTF